MNEQDKTPGAMVLVETFRDCLHRDMQPTFSKGDLRFWIEHLTQMSEQPPAVGGEPIEWAELGLPLAVLKEAFSANDSAERIANMNIVGTITKAFDEYQRIRAHVAPLLAELERLKTTEADLEYGVLLKRYTEAKARIAELEAPQDEQMACMPVDRCCDVRAKMIIAFNTAKKNGGDLDDCLEAAYKSALRFSPNPQNSRIRPPQ